jgi:hypothetical protein
MDNAFCPDCEEAISFKAQPKVGQRIVCSNCESELEVIETSPLELDWVYDEPVEDWDDDKDEGDWDDDDDDGDWEDVDDDGDDDWEEEGDDQDEYGTASRRIGWWCAPFGV